MEIYCCECQADMECRLTNGREIYPHRFDLADLPFWRCDGCKGYVGCHHKTATPTKPLGNIASAEIKNARRHIHDLIDPLWRNRIAPRQKLYSQLSKALGYNYHTGEIKTIEEARRVYVTAKAIIQQVSPPTAEKGCASGKTKTNESKENAHSR